MHVEGTDAVLRRIDGPSVAGAAPPLQRTPPGGAAATPAPRATAGSARAVVPGALRHVLRWGVTPYLALGDLTAAALAITLAGQWDGLDLAVVTVGAVLLFTGGAYRSRLTLSVVQDAGRLLGRTLVAGALVITADGVLSSAPQHVEAVRTTVAVGIGVLAVRAMVYALARYGRAHGLVSHRTIVLGAGQVGQQLAQLLQEHPEYGLRVLGFLDEQPLVGEDQLPAPVLGSDTDLAATIVRHGVENVIVAFGRLPGHGLVEVIRTCDRLHCEIFFVPRLFELHSSQADVEQVWGLPLIRHRRAAFRSPAWRVKRLVDVLVSGAALVLLAPLLVAIAAAVRWEGGPGIIFRQTRVGLDGRPFDLLKFRSLHPVDESESRTMWNIACDDRLGPVGRFLRGSSLDELPQFWNILRGDMSLVGPRPERPHFVDAFSSRLPRYVARHRVPAGLTGWAQVHGLRGDTSIADRARFDNYYIENWSLALDLRIVAMTVVSVLTRRGS